jgi:hypothetical protein
MARYHGVFGNKCLPLDIALRTLVKEKPMAKADIALLIVGIIALASALGWRSRA